jgi:hypothetical protein
LVLELSDLILQAKLALLDAGKLELIGGWGISQRVDRSVKITMLLAEQLDAPNDFLAFHAPPPAKP